MLAPNERRGKPDTGLDSGETRKAYPRNVGSSPARTHRAAPWVCVWRWWQPGTGRTHADHCNNPPKLISSAQEHRKTQFLGAVKGGQTSSLK